MRYFPNAISFSSKKSGNLETLKDKYIDLTVYPKRTLAVKRVFSLENKQMENRIHLPRYTVLKIKEIKISGPGSLVILSLEDWHGSLYETEVDLKYDVIVKNENYIEDLSDLETSIRSIRLSQINIGQSSHGVIWKKV